MNSLVVLLSLVTLAIAKPSQLIDSGIVAYSAPILATGAGAVSHQSRLDIQSSPAIVETAAYAPIATRAVIGEPTLLAAPAVAAPVAVSSQSRFDIKTSPAITSTVVAANPLAYSAQIAAGLASPALFNTEFIAPGVSTAAIAPTFLKTITPAISSPALIKSAAFVPGTIEAAAVSLDAPGIAIARATKVEANSKIIANTHLIKKRSAPLLATAPVLSYASAPLISTYGASPLTYTTPIQVGTPIITKTYSLHL